MVRLHLLIVSVASLLPLVLTAEVVDPSVNVEPKSYAGWKVFQLEVLEDELNTLLEDFEERDDVSVWKVMRSSDGILKVDVMMAPDVTPDQATLPHWANARKNLKWEVLIEDLGSIVIESHLKNLAARQGGMKMDWTQYHRYDVMEEYLLNIVTERRRTFTVNIGTSIEGRSIYAVVIGTKAKQVAKAITSHFEALYGSQNDTEGEDVDVTTLGPGARGFFDDQEVNNTTEAATTMNPDAKRKRPRKRAALGNVMILEAGMHSREWISPAFATYVIDKFTTENKKFQNLATWVVIPMANPDGYEFSHMRDRLWRKNRRVYLSSESQIAREACTGVDLNRNFGKGFGGKGTSNHTCSQIYRGPEAFSEPETRAIRDVLDALKGQIKFFLTAHSYGNMILYPWGNTKETSIHWQKLNETGMAFAGGIRQSRSTEYRVGQISQVISETAGGSPDYAHAEGVERSFVIELPGKGRGFLLPPSEIIPVAEETYCAMKCITYKIARRARDSRQCLAGCKQ